MEKERNNGKGIFYGVIGVATLIVAIIGATFAYFTASRSVDNAITGNAAAISFGLTVEKVTTVDEKVGGMIPMTDAMIGAAIEGTSSKSGSTKTVGGAMSGTSFITGDAANEVCTDDNGNAVCQVYKITLTNTGTASMFLDGFIKLSGGLTTGGTKATETNMRWVQVFATDTANQYSVSTTDIALANGKTGTAPVIFVGSTSGTVSTTLSGEQTTGSYAYGGNNYEYISNNYIRKSSDTATSQFTRANDKDETLVINQYLAPSGVTGDEATLYFAVWLTETGTDQTPTVSTAETPSSAFEFFSGYVEFNSATGGEVSATFNGYTKTTASA